MRYLGDNIFPGDVLLSNHPAAGGSHLPDLTVITPVCLLYFCCMINNLGVVVNMHVFLCVKSLGL